MTTLRSRLIGSYTLVIVICLTVAGIVLTSLLIPQVIRLTYLRLADKALPTALHVRTLRARGLTMEEIVSTLQEQAISQRTRILIVTREGRVLADTEDRWVGQRVDVPLRRDESGTSRLYVEGRFRTNEGLFFYVAISTGPTLAAERPQASPWYVVLLSPPRQLIASVVGEITIGFILAGLISLLGSIGVAFLIARSVAKPLQRISAATEEIAQGNYEELLDITSPEEIRRLADSFNLMAQEVKASRQAQQDFVANVSHDLKTPLTSIQGFSQALLDGAAVDEESRSRAAQVIHEEADHMGRLVDDLLDLARIEAGQVVMVQESVPLATLLQRSMEKMALRADEGQVTLELQMDGNPIVQGDQDRLAQVFTNLLDNALKHTPPGGRVVLTARSVAEGAKKRGQEIRTVVQITVADTGTGIPPEELSRIFERFYRGDKSRTKHGKGAGLGLAIAKEIIQAHGGQIRAESVVGLGTKFTISLPESRDSVRPP